MPVKKGGTIIVHDALERGRRPQVMTPELVLAARAVRSRGESIRAFAAMIGVNYLTVYAAAIGETWKHVQETR
jgi:hypothetical protein